MKYTTTVTLVVLCAILMANVALCDLYMHNPRGSINRNCERDANRRNANRLFDSQDNAAGGYACPRKVGGKAVKTPKMYYYEGSELYLEWTSQHSCGEHNNYCEMVIQYMCNDTVVGTDADYGDYYAVRDGIPTDANDDATDTISEATQNDLRYGAHEQFQNYFKCSKRLRNSGLYIADRNLGSQATSTRQNNGAERFGFECTEERDYYPYWHTSPWVDIAVYTSNTSMCQWYQENSQNVAPRGECWDAGKKNYLQYNNIRDCTDKDKTNVWVEVPAWGVDAPECLSSTLIAARDNYLGNSVDGQHATYKWTLPFIEKMPYDSVAKKTHHENCVLRMRYNITTTETPFFMDYKYNYRVNDKTSATPIRQDPWETFGYQSELHLAVNTNQYGRTFEDRSYVFEIRERPSTVPKWVTIHNLNVRGKRGNIVNVFPSVEYDFVPNTLTVDNSHRIHVQWTGSDYNPNRTPNNAEGGPKDPAQNGYRADRSNIVQMDVAGLNTPRKFSGITMFLKEDGTIDTDLVHKLAFLGQNIADNVTSCPSKTALLAKNNQNTANAELDDNNCGKLANTPYGPYFDGGLVQMWASGKFYYMCTRNNNFSNRGQKAIMIVQGGRYSAAPSTASPASTLLVVLCSVLIIAFNMLF
ncbi:hypothetical protein NAEGRDRAFT_83081 [Naegleria gruberi]|uniref:Protein DD3-3 n=1 Tax=Naegleria gruberi TaxID=5762 RepID=D2VAZ3_NAEGR|nr:uncharacterized protein NAEGRDRAFT_83081 [Naegleria gruberi]EFC46167.1 hypothetical protein NAEGRDRAFT_83081 [Naegleria gruberi]|eukprot:XP_002678911.1 hypothetical protein NAEGRDRAFT_83081 [Naegleria gruberi strain NEG-M]